MRGAGGDAAMRSLALIWIVVAVAFLVIYQIRRPAKVGLVVAFVIVLVVNYWLGAAVFALPAIRPIHDPIYALTGMHEVLIALIAFAVGSLVLARFFPGAPVPIPAGGPPLPSRRMAVWYLAVGAVSYIGLATIVARVPSATSVVAVGQQLVIVGLCLLAYHAWLGKKRLRFLAFVAVSTLFPIVTILAKGFLSFGAIAMFTVLAFAGTFARPRWAVVIVGVVVTYLCLSLFVTYFRDRNELRRTIWGGAAPSARVERLTDTLTRFEYFDPKNPEHLRSIEGRMSLSALTGVAVMRLEQRGNYAHGRTLLDAVAALVPRAFWPSKPEVGGAKLVSKYTGLRFGGKTSVGAGAVMELFINFGTPGVVVGFLLMGMAVTILDDRAARRLAAGDEGGFALVFIVGLSFLQTGGSFIDIAATAGASVVLMTLIRVATRPPQDDRPWMPALVGQAA